MSVLHELAEGDESFVAELLALYAEQAVELMETMRAARAIGDPKLLKRAAHTLAGASLSVDAEEVLQCAREIEGAASPTSEQLETLALSLERRLSSGADARG